MSVTEDVVINVKEQGAKQAADSIAGIAGAADKAATAVGGATDAMYKGSSASRTLTKDTSAVAAAQATLAGAFSKVTAAVGTMAAAIKTAGSALINFVGGFATLTSAALLSNIVKQGDAWLSYSNQLKAAGVSAKDLAKTQDLTADIARRSRTELSATVELYSALTRSSKEFGSTQKQVAAVTETINKSFALSGGSAQSAAGAIRQLNQAFSSGVLRGEELNSVLEQAPVLARVLASQLGVQVGKLKELGEQGKLTGRQVFEAILAGGRDVDKVFAQTNTTVAQAFQNIQTSFTQYLGKTSETTGATLILAKGLEYVANNFKVIADTLLTVTAAYIGYRAALIAASVAQLALNAAMSASPIGLIITGIGTLITAYLLWGKTTDDVKDKQTGLATQSESVFTKIGTWIKYAWDKLVELDAAFQRAGKSIRDAFGSALEWVKSQFTAWYDYIAGVIQTVIDKVKEAVNAIRSLAGNSSGNAQPVAGARASGGPVLSGSTYLVGEKGPELFTAGQTGTIIPNDALAANDNTTVINFDTPAFKRVFTESITDAQAPLLEQVTTGFTKTQDAIGVTNALLAKWASGSGGGSSSGGSMSAGGSSSSGGGSAYNVDDMTGAISGGSGGGSVSSGAPSGGGGSGGGGGGAAGPTTTQTIDEYIKVGEKYAQAVSNNTRQMIAHGVVDTRYTDKIDRERLEWSADQNKGFEFGYTRWMDKAPKQVILGGSVDTSGIGAISRNFDSTTRPRSASDQQWFDDHPGTNVYDISREVAGNDTSMYRGGSYTGQGGTIPFYVGSNKTDLSQGGAGFTEPKRYRSGGDFTIGGATGADSKLVQFMGSPGEEVSVKTREDQRREARDGNDNSQRPIIVQFQITTPDANSFRKSEKQIGQDIVGKLAKALR